MKAGRATSLVGAGILLVIVLIVSFWVIPRAAADTSPIASPEGVVNSFWSFAIADVCFGVAILGAASLARGGLSTARLVIAGIGSLLFGLLLLDGAFSFTQHRPSMQDVAAVLFWCVGGEGVAWALGFGGGRAACQVQKASTQCYMSPGWNPLEAPGIGFASMHKRL